MPKAQRFKAVIVEDSGATFLADVFVWDGTRATIAGITSISWEVFDANDPGSAAVATGTCTVATSVFDTQQKDPRWDLDDIGYNFRYDMAASSFPTGTDYEVEFKFTPASGEAFPVLFDCDGLALRAS